MWPPARARKIRVEYPGAIYREMNRGDRREAIFKGEADRELFLETLGKACAKTGWVVHAYCLMGDLREELGKAGWGPQEVAKRAKGDAVKLAVALRVRRETAMTLKWISQRLEMGARTHLNKRLYEQRRGQRS